MVTKAIKSITARSKQAPRIRVYPKGVKRKAKAMGVTKKAMKTAWTKTVKGMVNDLRQKKKEAQARSQSSKASSAAGSAAGASSAAGSAAEAHRQSSKASSAAGSAAGPAEASSKSSEAGNVKWQTAALTAISEKGKQEQSTWQRAEARNGLAPPVTPLRVKGLRVKDAIRGSPTSAAKGTKAKDMKGNPNMAKRKCDMDAKKHATMRATARSQQAKRKTTAAATQVPAVCAKQPKKMMLRMAAAKWRMPPAAAKKQRLETRAELNDAVRAWAQQWGLAV